MPAFDTRGASNIVSVCSAMFVALEWSFLHVLLKIRGLLLRGESDTADSVSMSKVLGLALGLLLPEVTFFSPSWDVRKHVFIKWDYERQQSYFVNLCVYNGTLGIRMKNKEKACCTPKTLSEP